LFSGRAGGRTGGRARGSVLPSQCDLRPSVDGAGAAPAARLRPENLVSYLTTAARPEVQRFGVEFAVAGGQK